MATAPTNRPIRPATEPLDVGLVINEIHYDADPKTRAVEFIELLNTGQIRSTSAATSSKASISPFPAGTILGVTEYLVIGENPAETYQYAGSLSADGEPITLRDAAGSIVDRVDYSVEFPWPIIDGGQSMQLINATLDNDLGGTWRPAFPTPGLPEPDLCRERRHHSCARLATRHSNRLPRSDHHLDQGDGS